MNTQATPKTQEPTNSAQICKLLSAISDDAMYRLDGIFKKLSVAKEPEHASKGSALN